MEKGTRRRLLDAAYDVLAQRGAGGTSVRAVEEAAGVPHGSVRHHFGSRAGLVAALVDDLVAHDQARAAESPAAMVERLLGPERTRTTARYELFLLAMRDPALRAHIVRARDLLVATVQSRLVAAESNPAAGVTSGTPADRARALVAALDGVILDGLLRGDGGTDLDWLG